MRLRHPSQRSVSWRQSGKRNGVTLHFILVKPDNIGLFAPYAFNSHNGTPAFQLNCITDFKLLICHVIPPWVTQYAHYTLKE